MTGLSRERASLLVVDIQERLAPAMPEAVLAQVIRNTTILIEGAKLLGLPILVSQQYPKGLGQTVAAIESVLPPTAQRFDKVEFSAGSMALVHPDARSGRDQFIIAGMEAHICVYQTARELVARGLRAFVAVDAICSRTKLNWKVGRDLIEKAGATVTSTETVLFELLGRAGTDEFKAISKLIK